MSNFRDREGDRRVLTLIGGGIIIVVLAIIAAIAFGRGMPDWAESVFAAIVGGMIVKLADVLSALVSLSSNRQIERVTDQLAVATPPGPQSVTIEQPPDQPVPVEAK
ncbi:hypothetical protein [Sphingobium yanoikuyae]|uniref:hypothetical protein n=1 Tax=Sphingobium yanoikuyae TaxID=13690 RepID=UPI00242F5535|nr:hypothetical protein [Sphingobium yanoikuyae]